MQQFHGKTGRKKSGGKFKPLAWDSLGSSRSIFIRFWYMVTELVKEKTTWVIFEQWSQLRAYYANSKKLHNFLFRIIRVHSMEVPLEYSRWSEILVQSGCECVVKSTKKRWHHRSNSSIPLTEEYHYYDILVVWGLKQTIWQLMA